MYVIHIIFGIAQFILIGHILITEAERKSPAVFMWATLLIMFAFPHLLTVFLDDMTYPRFVITQASFFVCCFCIIYLLSRTKKPFEFLLLKDKNAFEIEPSYIERSFFEYFCLFIFLISIIGYIIFIIKAQGGLFNTSWSSARSIRTSYVSFAGLSTRLIFTFSGFSLFYFLSNRRVKAMMILWLFIGLVIVTRNRVHILPILIFFASLYLIRIDRIRFRYIIIGILLAASSIYIIYAIRAFRYLGTISDAVNKFSWDYINTTVRYFLRNQNGELGLRQYFYYFIQHDNRFDGFNRGYTYLRMLLVFLPSRWSLGLKPQSFDLYMGQAVGMAAGGSMHPTLFGDSFANLWWFGVLTGGLWAFLANRLDSMINHQTENFFKIMLYCLSAYSFVVIGRGSVYNGFEVFAWGALILFLLKLISRSLSKVRFTFDRGA